MQTILPIAYFPPISWFIALLKSDAVIEKHENYVKQTIRNRCQIATANGVQRLSMPVVKAEKTTDVIIATHDNWQQKQWNAIATAYGESAFFDYYADDIKPFFTADANATKEGCNAVAGKNLFEHDVAIVEKILQLLDIDDVTLRYTDAFVGENYTRQSIYEKTIPPYYQVFRSKTGFIPDLSILDLLFNLGPEASCYLLKL